jgi:hypothetical protein
MKTVDRDLRGGHPAGQFDAGHDLGELALAVGAGAGVVAFEHEVIEVDRVLADRGDVDDAGRC